MEPEQQGDDFTDHRRDREHDERAPEKSERRGEDELRELAEHGGDGRSVHAGMDLEDRVEADGWCRDHDDETADGSGLHDDRRISAEHDEAQRNAVRQQAEQAAQQDERTGKPVGVFVHQAMNRHAAVDDVREHRDQRQEAEDERELAPSLLGELVDDEDRSGPTEHGNDQAAREHCPGVRHHAFGAGGSPRGFSLHGRTHRR